MAEASKFRLLDDVQLESAYETLNSKMYQDTLIPILNDRIIGLLDKCYKASSHDDAQRVRGRIDELKFLRDLPKSVSAEMKTRLDAKNKP